MLAGIPKEVTHPLTGKPIKGVEIIIKEDTKKKS
jgi:hypothetical protein